MDVQPAVHTLCCFAAAGTAPAAGAATGVRSPLNPTASPWAPRCGPGAGAAPGSPLPQHHPQLPAAGPALPRALVPAPPSCAPFLASPNDDPAWLATPDWSGGPPRRRSAPQGGAQPAITRQAAQQLLRSMLPAAPKQQLQGPRQPARELHSPPPATQPPAAAAAPAGAGSRAQPGPSPAQQGCCPDGERALCAPSRRSPVDVAYAAATAGHASSAPAMSRRSSDGSLTECEPYYVRPHAAGRSASWPPDRAAPV
eukprot:TRINITY_DN1773_c5_g1_i1.p2 TRINITY_DN1773_c5_g1~~TRINITY_DN1773_c5_g1_i1.p2  ORF type:complete len:255 (+),score=38.73 TRINITY_DN1773_c5_g1_i1:78-842(+)